MPQIGFECINTGEKLSFDDCIACATEGGKPRGGCHFTPEILIGIHRNIYEIPIDKLTVTKLIGETRRAIITARYSYWVTPKKNFWAFRGTLAHQLIDGIARPGVLYEHRCRRTIRIDDTEHEITGRVDVLIPESPGYILDYKSCRMLPKGDKPLGNHELQVNIYRWLVTPQIRIDNLRIVYFDMGGVKRVTAQVMPLSEVEQFVVAQATAYLHAVRDDIIPAGKYDGRAWQCRYCDVADICKELG